jgi:hypothetical protein
MLTNDEMAEPLQGLQFAMLPCDVTPQLLPLGPHSTPENVGCSVSSPVQGAAHSERAFCRVENDEKARE